MPESNRPDACPGVPEVTLCGEPFQFHLTVSPAWIETVDGEKIRPPDPTSTVKVVAAARPTARRTARATAPTTRRLQFIAHNKSALHRVNLPHLRVQSEPRSRASAPTQRRKTFPVADAMTTGGIKREAAIAVSTVAESTSKITHPILERFQASEHFRQS